MTLEEMNRVDVKIVLRENLPDIRNVAVRMRNSVQDKV